MCILLLLMRFPYLINGAFTPPAAKSGTPPHRPPTREVSCLQMPKSDLNKGYE